MLEGLGRCLGRHLVIGKNSIGGSDNAKSRRRSTSTININTDDHPVIIDAIGSRRHRSEIGGLRIGKLRGSEELSACSVHRGAEAEVSKIKHTIIDTLRATHVERQ